MKKFIVRRIVITNNKFNDIRICYLFKLGKKGLGYYRDL